jgi:hypothetical protein
MQNILNPSQADSPASSSIGLRASTSGHITTRGSPALTILPPAPTALSPKILERPSHVSPRLPGLEARGLLTPKSRAASLGTRNLPIFRQGRYRVRLHREAVVSTQACIPNWRSLSCHRRVTPVARPRPTLHSRHRLVLHRLRWERRTMTSLMDRIR